MNNKIVVVLSGGVLNSIFSSAHPAGTEVVVIDYDEVGEAGLTEEELDETLEEASSGLTEIY